MSPKPPLEVLVNAQCPVCRIEVQAYARHARAQGVPMRLDDLNGDACADWGLDPDTAARRLHVRHQGQLTTGIAAFLVLWAHLPRYRWLARVVGLPVIRPLAEIVYDRVLAPALYRWHLRRKDRTRSRA